MVLSSSTMTPTLVSLLLSSSSLPSPTSPTSIASLIANSTRSSLHKLLPKLLYSVAAKYITPRSLIDTHNQIDEFTDRQALVQRILATSSSCASISLCVCGMYMFLSIDPKRLIFRHQLIFFLLFFDLVKAIILLLYPTRVLTHSSSYYNDKFCQVVGFFTATAIEGADIAILSFAVHTYLLIFKPNLTTRVKNSLRNEGGLYKFRFYVYGLSFFIPVILASLAFVNGTGYVSLVCWCYLPERPLWYRFVLSWVPRYCIVIIIFTFYGLIYYHVIKEFRTLGGVFTTIHNAKDHNLHPNVSNDGKLGFLSSIQYFFMSLKDRCFLKLTLPERSSQDENDDNIQSGVATSNAGGNATNSNNNYNNNTTNSNDNSNDPQKDEEASDNYDEDDENVDLRQLQTNTQFHAHDQENMVDPEIHAANLANFRKRQRIIEKQMKSIFIYPFAYIFVWVFPFVLHVTQINYEEHHGPIYWINCMGAFMQPFNGFVDTLVFFYREQPWKYTIMQNFEKEHKSKLDNFLNLNQEKFFYGTDESIATSSKLAKNSLSASMVSNREFPKWRRVLNWLRLPFFELPTEENIDRFQTNYITKKVKSNNQAYVNSHGHDRPVRTPRSNSYTSNYIGHSQTNNINNPFDKDNSNGNAGITKNPHDFSNILSGDLGESEFTNSLGKFTFNFDGKRENHTNTDNHVMNGGTVKKRSINLHPHEADSNYLQRQSLSNGRKPSVISSTNKSSKSSKSNRNDLDTSVIELRTTKKNSSNSSSSGSPFSNRKSTSHHSISNYLNGNSNGVTSGTSVSSTSNLDYFPQKESPNEDDIEDDDDEIDFLEFLKKGPPR